MVHSRAMAAIPINQLSLGGLAYGSPGLTALQASRDIAAGEADKWKNRIGKKLWPKAQEKYQAAQAEVDRLDLQISSLGGGVMASGSFIAKTFGEGAESAFVLGSGALILLGGAFFLLRRRRK